MNPETSPEIPDALSMDVAAFCQKVADLLVQFDKRIFAVELAVRMEDKQLEAVSADLAAVKKIAHDLMERWRSLLPPRDPRLN